MLRSICCPFWADRTSTTRLCISARPSRASAGRHWSRCIATAHHHHGEDDCASLVDVALSSVLLHVRNAVVVAVTVRYWPDTVSHHRMFFCWKAISRWSCFDSVIIARANESTYRVLCTLYRDVSYSRSSGDTVEFNVPTCRRSRATIIHVSSLADWRRPFPPPAWQTGRIRPTNEEDTYGIHTSSTCNNVT